MRFTWLPGLIYLCAMLSWTTPAGAAWSGSADSIRKHPTWIYTPATSMSNGKHGLMIVLHGCAQTHTQLKDFGNLDRTAEENAIVLALPSVGAKSFGPSQCWDYNGARDDKRHIAELADLARDLAGRAALNIDPRHVYIAGLSSGAAMALDVACKAPDVIAGVGAVAGPSVGSNQNMALVEDRAIPAGNVTDAVRACTALAGARAGLLERQIASIGFGDMDLNGANERFRLSALPTDAERNKHAGQIALVSVKWSLDNAAALRQLYAAEPFGPEQAVLGGLGTQRVARKDGKARIALLSIANVGHAWPAGSGQPNVPPEGGLWIAQSGLNYLNYVAGWLISNNPAAPAPGVPLLGANAVVDARAIAVSGNARDPDGAIAHVDTVLLKETGGVFQQIDRHGPLPLGADGNFVDRFENLADALYQVQVGATDNAANTATVTLEARIGPPPAPRPCFTDNNYQHVQKGRANQCGNGFTCAKGSGDNLGLFNLFVKSDVEENPPGFFRKAICASRR